MNGTLIIGDRAYSSWSLRGWLAFERFGLPVETRLVSFADASVPHHLRDHPPARTVPLWLAPDGAQVADSLAIAEELASRQPGARHWPADPRARATARSLAFRMHDGFGALRTDCPMNLRVAYAGVELSDDVRADLDLLAELWSHARAICGPDGPWLCGDYSIADACFAPVAARIATYGLPMPPEAMDYVAAHLADPAFRRWRAMALAGGPDLPWYARGHARRDWPGPKVVLAADADGPSVNGACPCSGKPVTDFLAIDGTTFGFCNAFCRDKTQADPAAWPAFAALAGRYGVALE